MQKEIKIIVVSDVHGNVQGLEKIINNIEHDFSIISGDFQCSDSIINKNITYAVRGNNDWDSNYPDHLDFEIERFKFHLEHGHLTGSYSQLDNYDFMHKMLLDKKCDFFIFGHTHIPRIFKYDEGYAINPGSITLPRGGSKPSYVIITIKSNKDIDCQIVEFK